MLFVLVMMTVSMTMAMALILLDFMPRSMTSLALLIFHEINTWTVTFCAKSALVVTSSAWNLTTSSVDYSWASTFSASIHEWYLRNAEAKWIVPIVWVRSAPSVAWVCLIAPACHWSVVESLILILIAPSLGCILIIKTLILILAPVCVWLLISQIALIGSLISPWSIVLILVIKALILVLISPSLIGILIAPLTLVSSWTLVWI